MDTVKDKLKLLLASKLSIRNSIIRKGQEVAGTDPFSSYAEKIDAIQTGIDTSDATAGEGDILSGKTAYADGKKITGSIPGRGAADLTASGAAVTAPAGYYPSQVTKKVAEAAQAAPSITIGSNGLITASVSQGEGYVAAGTRSATRQLTTQAGKTVTPGTSLQTAVASGRYTTGTVYVAGDANLAAGNIKSGVSIFGVSGSYTASPNTYRITFSGEGVSRSIIAFTDLFNIDRYLTNSPNGITYDIMAGSIIFIRKPAVLSSDEPSGPIRYLESMGLYDYGSPQGKMFLYTLTGPGTITIPS